MTIALIKLYVGWVEETKPKKFRSFIQIMQYRRVKVKGETYFFTLVTYNRQPFLTQPENIDLLRKAFHYVMQKHPFTIDAITAGAPSVSTKCHALHDRHIT